MALAAGTNTTYLVVGNKENIRDTIYEISPDETPLFSTIRKTEATQKTHQWQTDDLAASTINSQLEGDDYTVSTSPATTLLNNVCQISAKTYGVSGSQRATASYGRADQLLYDKLQRGLELRTDVEVVLMTNQAKGTGSATTARKSAGLPAWITNTCGPSSMVAPIGDGTDISTAISNSTVLTYELLASAQQLAFEDGGNPSIMMLPPNLKRRFSSLAFSSAPSTADVRYNVNSSKAPIAVGTVEKWLSDFGEVDVVVNRQMARQAATFMRQAVFLIDPRYLEVALLRNFEDSPLAKTGDSDRGFMTVEYTLVPTAPKAHAIVVGVT